MGVPKYNMIDATLEAGENGALVVKFGDSVITVPAEVAAKLTAPELIGGSVKLGIAPEALHTEADADTDAVIKAVADFTEPFPRYTAVYSALKGKTTFLVAKHALDADIKNGAKLNYYVNPADIMLFDPTTGEKVIAFRAVTENKTMAKVVTKETVVTPKAPKVAEGEVAAPVESTVVKTAAISFGKSKVIVPNDNGEFTDGEYEVIVDYKNMECTKEAAQASPKLVITGVVEDADVLGDNTIVYARVDGMLPYFSGIVAGTPKLNIGDKIKFVIKPDGVKKA